MRDQYLFTAQRVLDEAQRRIDKGVFPCSQCAYARYGWILDEAYCRQPVVLVAQRNTVKSYDRGRLAECEYQRGTSQMYGPVICGPDGEFFEHRLPWRERFWAWFTSPWSTEHET